MIRRRSRGWKFGLLIVVPLLVTASCGPKFEKFVAVQVTFHNNGTPNDPLPEPAKMNKANDTISWVNDSDIPIHVCVAAGVFATSDFPVKPSSGGNPGTTSSGPVQSSTPGDGSEYPYYIYQDAIGFKCPAQLGSGKYLVGPKHIIVQ